MQSRQYDRPPIIERALSLGVTIDDALFERQLESWKELIQSEFPTSQTLPVWDIEIAQRDGAPFFDPERQKMSLRHRFWKGPSPGHDSAVQIWRDRVVFNLLSTIGTPRHFEDLAAVAKAWLPRWKEHFQVSTFRGVELEYVNLISAKTCPDFTRNTSLEIHRIVRFFGDIPRTDAPLIPPYEFQVNTLEREKPPLRLHARLHSVTGSAPPELQLRFVASTEREMPVGDVWGELDIAHELILDAFESYFTEEAKEAFKPRAA